MKLSFEFNNYKVEYNVTFRKRIGVAIQVEKNGDVNVYAPIGLSIATVKDIVLAKAQFILQKLGELEFSNTTKDTKEDFLQCMYLGKNYGIEKIEKIDQEKITVKLVRGKFVIEGPHVDDQKAKEELANWFKVKTGAKAKERLKVHGQAFEKLPKKVEADILQNRRWEMKDNTLVLDINTLIAPVCVLDSVLIESLSNINEGTNKEIILKQFGEIIEETNVWLKENPRATRFF